jgi:hypothetical protein
MISTSFSPLEDACNDFGSGGSPFFFQSEGTPAVPYLHVSKGDFMLACCPTIIRRELPLL